MVLIRDRPEVTFWEGTLHPQVLSFSRSVIIPLQHTFDLITHILIFWETVFLLTKLASFIVFRYYYSIGHYFMFYWTFLLRV